MGAVNEGQPLKGSTGAIYFKTQDFTSANLSFDALSAGASVDDLTFDSATKTITSVADADFSNFEAGMVVYISGCTTETGNNGRYTVVSATTLVLTVAEAVTDATEAGTVVVEAPYIADSESSFNTVGYLADDIITISGSDSNDDIFTVEYIATDYSKMYISTSDTSNPVTTEAAGSSITIAMPSPGRKIFGCQNWEISRDVTVVDTTTFDSGEYSEFDYIRQSWTGTIDRLYIIGKSISTYIGKKLKGVFFQIYQSTPTTAEPAIYHEGDIILNSETITINNSEIVQDNVGFQGSGTLTEYTQETAWSNTP